MTNYYTYLPLYIYIAPVGTKIIGTLILLIAMHKFSRAIFKDEKKMMSQ